MENVKIYITLKTSSLLKRGGGVGNNWAAEYGEGEKYYKDIIDLIDREADGSDSLESFEMTHSIAGGTGSGFVIFVSIKFSKLLIQTYSVFPKENDIVV